MFVDEVLGKVLFFLRHPSVLPLEKWFTSKTLCQLDSMKRWGFFKRAVVCFPSKILMSDVASIMIGAFILVIIAAIYPARRAGKVNISEVLRHE